MRTAISRRLAADVRQYGLQDALQSIVEQTSFKDVDDARATVHIPDPLYANQLYQLLDYWPKGGGSGRTFSTRSGIIGMAWRTRKPDTWHQNSGVDNVALVRMWGMTPKEAEERKLSDKSKLFLAIPLMNAADAVVRGVFYVDAPRANLGLHKDPEKEKDAAETEANKFVEKVTAEILAAYESMMAEPLDKLVQAAMAESPQIDLEGP